jgi:hypothetical protein
MRASRCMFVYSCVVLSGVGIALARDFGHGPNTANGQDYLCYKSAPNATCQDIVKCCFDSSRSQYVRSATPAYECLVSVGNNCALFLSTCQGPVYDAIDPVTGVCTNASLGNGSCTNSINTCQ